MRASRLIGHDRQRRESIHEEGRRREDGVTVKRHPMRINKLSSRTQDADELLAQIDVGRKYLLNSLAAHAQRPTRSDNADRYRTFPEVCVLRSGALAPRSAAATRQGGA